MLVKVQVSPLDPNSQINREKALRKYPTGYLTEVGTILSQISSQILNEGNHNTFEKYQLKQCFNEGKDNCRGIYILDLSIKDLISIKSYLFSE